MPSHKTVVTADFIVVKIDSSDGTVLLSNPDFKARGLGDRVWVICESPLQEGQKVHGGLDIDPRIPSEQLRFPVFTPLPN